MESCRVCMSSSVSLVDIFSDRPLPDDQFSLADMLNELVDFKVKRDDKLPQKICVTCGLNTQTAFKFQRQFQQSHQLLCMKAMESEHDDLEPKLGKKSLSPMESLQASTARSTIDSRSRSSSSTELSNKDYSFDELVSVEWNNSLIHSGRSSQSHRYPLRQKKAPTYSSKRVEISYSSTGRQFKCDQCQSTFASQHSLNRHKLTHNCLHCWKGFKLKSNLFEHLFVHSEERSIRCHLCELALDASSTLQMHLIEHSDHSGLKCHICHKTYSTKNNVKRHMKSHIFT